MVEKTEAVALSIPPIEYSRKFKNLYRKYLGGKLPLPFSIENFQEYFLKLLNSLQSEIDNTVPQLQDDYVIKPSGINIYEFEGQQYMELYSTLEITSEDPLELIPEYARSTMNTDTGVCLNEIKWEDSENNNS